MTDTDTELRLKQQAEWLKKHTLSPEQVKQLFQNKLDRAAEWHKEVKKREALCGGRQYRNSVYRERDPAGT